MIFKIIDWVCCKITNATMFFVALAPRRNEYDYSPSRGKKHILIIANDLLGDALARVPFYAMMRRVFPPETYHIAVMLTPPIAKLLSPLPFFDEIVAARQLCCSHPIRWLFSRKQFIDVSLRWALTHKTDIYINPFRFRSLGHDYILKLTEPGVSIAYETVDQARVFPVTAAYQKAKFDSLYTHLLPIRPNVSQIEEMQNMISLAAGNRFELTRVPQAVVDSIIDRGVENSLEKPYVVIVPGAGAEYRRWPVERFAQVAGRLGRRVVAVGTKDESPLGDAIPGAVNLCGRTTLSELGAVLSGASLVITNETGTATYAAVVGARTLCLVGGGDFKAFFPNDFYGNTRSVCHPERCFGCRWDCPRADLRTSIAPCMDAITVDEVCAAAKEMLDECGK